MRKTVVILSAIVAVLAGRVEAEETGSCRAKVRVGTPAPAGAKLTPLTGFDHVLFDDLLHRFVDCHGQVSYRKWKNDCAAVAQLQTYLESLSLVDLREGKKHPQAKQAFYINAYNALVLYGILRDYPVVSIQSLNKQNASYRIFDDLEVCISGEYRSLNTIEHNILRPMGDFRVHFALVCAARGCPKLRNEAFTAEKLEAQFCENARDFFASTHRWQLIRPLGIVRVSPILKWFHEDFGKCDQEMLSRIQPYLPCHDGRWIAERQQPRVFYLGYNWALNDRHPPPFQRSVALPYTLFATVEPTLRPLVSLVKPEEGGAGAAGPAEDEPEPPKPQPLPSGDEEPPPPPKVLKPKTAQANTGKLTVEAGPCTCEPAKPEKKLEAIAVRDAAKQPVKK